MDNKPQPFTLFGAIPQSFVIAPSTALEEQLQCIPQTRRAPLTLTLTFAACFSSELGALHLLHDQEEKGWAVLSSVLWSGCGLA